MNATLPSSLSVLRVTGRDRITWLNNLVTQNVKALPLHTVTETFFTNVKGKAIGHGWILHLEDCLLMVGVPGQTEPLLQHLDRYLFREQVAFACDDALWHWSFEPDLAAATKAWQLESPLSAETAGKANSVLAVRKSPQDTTRYSHLAFSPSLIGSPAGWLGRNLELSESLEGTSQPNHLEAAGDLLDAWNAMRIESGTPWFGVDFDDQHLPQELDRDPWAISFTKGCYLGQETIARLDALGQVQKKLFRLKWESRELPTLPCPIYANDQEVGRLTSAAWSVPGQQCMGLGMIKRAYFQPTVPLQIAGTPLTLETIPHP